MEKEKFGTADLLLAAFLQTRAHELLGLVPDKDASRAVFVFADSERIQRDAKDFFEDGLVPVRSLARRISRLRSRCWAFRQRPMERR